MRLKTINLSTGPVQLSQEVLRSLRHAPISHRSARFRSLYRSTEELLRGHFKVRSAVIMTGSGTLADEVMLHQIKLHGGKGLIIVNGEFGQRLCAQAARLQIVYDGWQLDWGEQVQLDELRNRLSVTGYKWLLFCHCETSTGVVNPLDEIVTLCKEFGCNCFVDCMSSVGTMPIDLSGVAMATASSGKGFAGLPGLAIVLSNIEFYAGDNLPTYLDLGWYERHNGIPYTMCSALLEALHTSLGQKLTPEMYERLLRARMRFHELLDHYALIPFASSVSSVYTVVLNGEKRNFEERMRQQQLAFGFESNYLLERNWLQIALLGFFDDFTLNEAFNRISKTLQQIIICKKSTSYDTDWIS